MAPALRDIRGTPVTAGGRARSPRVNIPALAAKFRGRGQSFTIAVDASTVVVPYLHTAALAVQQRRTPPISATVVRTKLTAWTTSLRFEENGVRLIFVFDGVDNPAKEDKCRGERTRERGKAEAALADSENAGSPSALWNLKAKTTEVDADVIANIMAWCDEREWATYISAWSEADAELVRLQMDGTSMRSSQTTATSPCLVAP